MSLAVVFPKNSLVDKPPIALTSTNDPSHTHSQFSAWREARKVRFLDPPVHFARPSFRRLHISPLLAMTNYPEQFHPNFETKYSVTVPQPITIVFAKLATMEGLEQSIRLSALCSGFEMLQKDTVQCSGPLSKAYLRTTPEISPDSDSSVSDILPRQHFTLAETVPIIPKVKSVTVNLKGTLTWDSTLKVALYETSSDKGIHVWKLRVFETASDGKSTKITETIRGMCPAWQQWIVQRTTTRSHRDHMDLYHTLI